MSPPTYPPEADHDIAKIVALLTEIENGISSLVDEATSKIFKNGTKSIRNLLPDDIGYPRLFAFKRLTKKLKNNWTALQKSATNKAIDEMKQTIDEILEYLKAF